jgi:hypothetical protein
LAALRNVLAFAKAKESEFVRIVERNSGSATEKAFKSKRVEFKKADERAASLNRIIRKIYEDNLEGKISDERFAILLADYEAEQKVLKEKLVVLKTELEQAQEEKASVGKFLNLVKQYTEIPELTAEIARTFIDKIVVHECVKQPNGRKRKSQELEIYFNHIGKFDNIETP